MIIIDPVTRQRVVTMPHIGDIEYNLDAGSEFTISQEDVPLIGPWSDYTGSDINVSSRNQQLWGGHENSMQGTDTGLMGNRLGNLTSRGNRAGTHRQRTIKRYVKLDGNGKAIKFE